MTSQRSHLERSWMMAHKMACVVRYWYRISFTSLVITIVECNIICYLICCLVLHFVFIRFIILFG